MAKISLFAVVGGLSCLVGGLIGEAVLAGWPAVQGVLHLPVWLDDPLRVGLWTAGLGVLLALGLVVGQNLYLRRRPIGPGQFLAATIGSICAGLVAGGAGQGMQRVLERVAGALSSGARGEIAQGLGWMLLGGLLAACIAAFVPNLPKARAASAGAIGGLLGAWVFFDLAAWVGDTAGRLAGAAALGACVGSMLAVAERAFRKAWLEVAYGPRESRTVSLGGEPVTVGSAGGATIHARGAPPQAYRFRLQAGQVVCEDVAAGRSTTLAAGDSRRVGNLVIRVHAATGGDPASTAAAAEPRLVVAGRNPVALRVGATLTPADIPGLPAAEGRRAVAEVVTNPSRPGVIGLRNLSTRTWQLRRQGRDQAAVPAGRTVEIQPGCRIDFGSVTGSIEAALAAPSSPGGRRGALIRGVVAAGVAAGLLGLGAVDFRRRHPAPSATVGGQSLPITILSLNQAGKQRRLRLGVLPTRDGYDDIGIILKDLGPGYSFSEIDWDALQEPDTDVDLATFDVLFMPCPGLPAAASEETITERERDVEADPEDPDALAGLAWNLATSPVDGIRDGGRAVGLARKACELTDWKDPKKVRTFAACCAEAGDFRQAIASSADALELCGDSPDHARVKESVLEERESYAAGLPIRDGIPPAVAERIRGTLRQYVAGGGTLYASCLAWVAIAGTFPEVTASEFKDLKKRLGIEPDAQEVTAEVVDPGMREEFGDTISLAFDLPGWSPPEFHGGPVDVYLQGQFSLVCTSDVLLKDVKNKADALVARFRQTRTKLDQEAERLLAAVKAGTIDQPTFKAEASRLQEASAANDAEMNAARQRLVEELDAVQAVIDRESKRSAPLLAKMPFGDGFIIFTAFHNGKQRSSREVALLKHLVYTTVTARLEARTREQLVEAGFTAARHDLVTRSPGSPERRGTYSCSRPGPLRFAVGFDGTGVRLRLDLVSPDGRTATHTTTEPVVVEVPDAAAGDWSYIVTAERLPSDNFPFTITIAEK